ncbi:MAG: Membrane transport protein [Firmicutes bacterium ADurb.Bin182]|nr:MAG: Membrane transport protein [Firmicutes bacterium ADurb.Bin182]
MNKTLTVIKIVLPVLTAILLGLAARKRNALTSEGVTGIKTFVIRFTLPALIFGAFYKAAYDYSTLICFLIIFLACCAGYLTGRLIQRVFIKNRPLLPFLTTGFEMGMMGYALYIMLFGEENLSNMAIADLGQVLFVFTVYQTLLNMKKDQGIREAVRTMITTPVFIAIALGVIFGLTGLGSALSNTEAGGVIEALIEFIGKPTACAILFAVGYDVKFSKSSMKDAFFAALARIGVMAALCFLTLMLLDALIFVGSELKWAVILMFALPAPFVLPVFVESESEAGYVSTCLSLYTLISVGLFAAIAAVIQ